MVSEIATEQFAETPEILKTEVDLENRCEEPVSPLKEDLPEKKPEEPLDNKDADLTVSYQ